MVFCFSYFKCLNLTVFVQTEAERQKRGAGVQQSIKNGLGSCMWVIPCQLNQWCTWYPLRFLRKYVLGGSLLPRFRISGRNRPQVNGLAATVTSNYDVTRYSTIFEALFLRKLTRYLKSVNGVLKTFVWPIVSEVILFF